MANGLRQRGFSAPDIYHADLEQGLLLIEDLGDERVVEGDPPAPITERYETAVDVLLALHEQRLPDVAAGGAACRVPHPLLRHGRLPDRGRAAARLVPAALRRCDCPTGARDEFQALWRELLQPAIDSPPTWVLRDYHSPNLLWLPERNGPRPLGILDFQDAADGPGRLRPRLAAAGRAGRRARTDGGRAARPLRARRRRATIRTSTPPQFIQLYVTLAAQRASKILGIFARLDLRDGKPQYLRHMPRVWGYLQRSLGASGAGAAQRVVRCQCAGVKDNLSFKQQEPIMERCAAASAPRATRHGAGRRAWHAHAPLQRRRCPSRWSRSAARR